MHMGDVVGTNPVCWGLTALLTLEILHSQYCTSFMRMSMLQWLQTGFDQLHLDIVGLSVSLNTSHVLGSPSHKIFLVTNTEFILIVLPSSGKLL